MKFVLLPFIYCLAMVASVASGASASPLPPEQSARSKMVSGSPQYHLILRSPSFLVHSRIWLCLPLSPCPHSHREAPWVHPWPTSIITWLQTRVCRGNLEYTTIDCKDSIVLYPRGGQACGLQTYHPLAQLCHFPFHPSMRPSMQHPISRHNHSRPLPMVPSPIPCPHHQHNLCHLSKL